MSSKIPTVQQVSWAAIIPQVALMAIMIIIWIQIDPEKGFIYGALNYLIVSFCLRRLVPQSHRKGMKKIQNENFEMAIPDFERSYHFFSEENNWIDKYRFITLLSSSKISYSEMALLNIAFCYSQIGKGEKAKETYKRVLNEFPESAMAKVGLRSLESVS